VGTIILLISVQKWMRFIGIFPNRNLPNSLYIDQSISSPAVQKMVASNPSPPQGGMEGTPQLGGSSSNFQVFMCDQMVSLQTQAHNYETPEVGPLNQIKCPLPSLVALSR
jgi:hypothetical protein